VARGELDLLAGRKEPGGLSRERRGVVAWSDFELAFVGIDKGVVVGLNRYRQTLVCSEPYVKVQRVGAEPLHGAGRLPAGERERAGDHAGLAAAGKRDDGNILRLQVPVARGFHLLRRRQVDPE